MTMDSPKIVFYPKRSTTVLLLMGSSAFVAIGIVLFLSGKWLGLAAAAFFSLGIPISVIQILPGSSYLRLEETGFTFCNLFRKTSIPWSDINEFTVVTPRKSGLSTHRMVGFDFVSSYERARLARHIAKGITGSEGALPDTYGKTAKGLAELMNSHLRKARQRDQAAEFPSDT